MATTADDCTEPQEGRERTGRHERLSSTGSDTETRRFAALVELFVARMPEALR